MSFPGKLAVLLADITLIVQIAAFVMLLFGIMHAKKKDFPKHFKTADIAVILGIIAFFWMGLSLLNKSQSLLSGLANPIITVTLLHASIGSLAMLGGIAFVSGKFIKKTPVPMRMVFLLWTLALFLGITLYMMYYVY